MLRLTLMPLPPPVETNQCTLEQIRLGWGEVGGVRPGSLEICFYQIQGKCRQVYKVLVGFDKVQGVPVSVVAWSWTMPRAERETMFCNSKEEGDGRR